MNQSLNYPLSLPQRSDPENDINNNVINNMDQQDDVLKHILTLVGSIIGIIIILILLRLYIQGPFYYKKNRIDDKVVIVTGCNTGIGKETALELAKRGAKVYMACRDTAKCETARLEIIKESQNQNVFNRELDLSSLESIKKFADRFLQEETRLDILINNAGVMACPKNYTKDGYELQFGVNHLGHFYLTTLLLGLLQISSPSRIVIVSSALYFIGTIKKDDINSEKSYTRFSAYAQSKLANVIFTKYLSRKIKDSGVTVNCCHPGVVKTELSRHIIKSVLKKILNPFTSYLMKTPKAGAQTTLRLALDPKLEEVTGHYYFDTYIRFPIIPKAKNPEIGEWLWNKSEELIKQKQNDNGQNDDNLKNSINANNTTEVTIERHNNMNNHDDKLPLPSSTTSTTTTTTTTTTTSSSSPTVIDIPKANEDNQKTNNKI